MYCLCYINPNLTADSTEGGAHRDLYFPAIPYQDQYYPKPDEGIKQDYQQWVWAHGTKLKIFGKSVVLITNPFKAIYALYATVAGEIENRNYNYQFFGTGKGNYVLL